MSFGVGVNSSASRMAADENYSAGFELLFGDGHWGYVTPESYKNGTVFLNALANVDDYTVNGVLDSGVFLAVNGRSQEELEQLGEQGLRLLPGYRWGRVESLTDQR